MDPAAIRHITVIGAGVMGHGIAHLAAMSGFSVVLYDIQDEFVQRGMTAIRGNLNKAVEKGKLSREESDATFARITGTADFTQATRQAQVVIEAIPEDIKLKQNLFNRLSVAVSPECILATNTSSLSVSEIARAATHPGRVIGMHFFNPPYIMKLLEVVTGEQTAPAVLDAVKAIGGRLGRTVIVVKDSPGFATSRLGLALGLEAIRMLETGVASAQDIDTAMELGYNHPMGPLKLTDVIGLDTRLNIARYLHESLKSNAFAPPKLLEQMVRDGKLGKKSGQGFYTWDSK